MKGSREKDLTASLPSPTQASIRTLREHLDDIVHEGIIHEGRLSSLPRGGLRMEPGAHNANATIVSGLSAPGPLPPILRDYSFFVLTSRKQTPNWCETQLADWSC